VNAASSFEHVPPRGAFNDGPLRLHGIENWLTGDDGQLDGGRIQQRGSGVPSLCGRCNNDTGSWYAKELITAAASGARILRELSLKDLDKKLEPAYIEIAFRQSETGPHPLRFIKQIITMLLAVSPLEFSLKNPLLGDFVLDRERTGLPNRYQVYLALYAGPLMRIVGGAARLKLDTSRTDFIVEVAFPPFAYAMTVDSEPEGIETTNITACANARYMDRADLEMQMLVGFGHTPLPADYRTKAMVNDEAARNKAMIHLRPANPT